MRTRGVVAEDFVNYKVPSMFIASCFCDFKCCREAGLEDGACQNASLLRAGTREISDEALYRRFAENPIPEAVVVGGLEPFLQFDEVLSLLRLFRERGCAADFVIYTGYRPDEIQEQIGMLRQFENVAVKFGRFVPGRPPRYDEILGVELSSDNQFAERIS